MRYTLTRKKRPSEKFPIGVDLTSDLNTGDAPSTFTAVALDGAQDVSSTILETPQLSGNVALVTVKNGVDGKNYVVVFTITTQAGYVYQHDVVVPVSGAA